MLVIKNRNSAEKMMNEDIAWIDANEIGPTREVCGDVFVDKIKSADGNGEEQRGLGKFECSNKQKTARPGRMRSHEDHFTLRGSRGRTKARRAFLVKCRSKRNASVGKGGTWPKGQDGCSRV